MKTKNYEMLTFEEAKALKVGDKVKVGLKAGADGSMVYYDATVVRPLFWNSDADEPDWEVETTFAFVDVYSMYKVVEN